MQKVGNNKIFYLPMIPGKQLFLQRDLTCTKRNLATECLAYVQINRYPGNATNIQACYEKLFCSVSLQFLTQFFWIFHRPQYLVYQGYVHQITIASFLIDQSQIDFVILSQSIDLQLPILLMQWTAVVFSERVFI